MSYLSHSSYPSYPSLRLLEKDMTPDNLGLLFGGGMLLQVLGLAWARPSVSGFLTSLAVVFAPLEGNAADGIRRFLPVKLGGHRGVVLIP